MTALTRIALYRPLTVYVLMVIVAVGGLATYRALPRESFPEIRVPFMIISTVYPGTTPEDIESQVTRKIETELKGLSGIKEIRSTSLDGYSLIEVEFNPDVDLDTALQKVREKVDLARPELPADAEDPVIQDFDFSRLPILVVNVAANLGMDRLKQIADDISDELEEIPGVNLVNIIGGRDREVQIFVDPQRMAAFDVGLVDVERAIEREHLTLPAGTVDIGRQRLLVRTPAEVDDPLEIADFVVDDRGGNPVRIRDIGRVVYGYEDETSRARVDRRTAISLTVEKRTGANIIEVADAVRARLAELAPRLPAAVELSIIGDQSVDIRDMVRELENNILSGLLLVLLVLFVAMGWRPAVIVAAAIPFSMLITFIVLAVAGYTLNMVVLFSLVLVLGMLVDNAIVTVENIYRHRELGDAPGRAALDGAREVAMPIIASTATTLCAFAPMLFWPGIIGEFMKFLPLTLIFGLSASLFVALVFNPALALKLFRAPVRPSARRRRPLTAAYRRLLAWALDHRAIVLLAMGLFLVATVLAYGVLGHGVEFFPDTDPRQIFVDLEFPPGTNLDAQDRVVRQIEQLLADIPDVESMLANVGSKGVSNDGSTFGGGGTSNESRVTLNLYRFFERSQSSRLTMQEVRRRLAGRFPGVNLTVDKPQDGPQTGKPVTIRLRGEDYDALGEVAEEVVRRLRGIDGLLNVDHDYDTGNPEIRVLVDRDAAARARTSTREIALAVRTALAGAEVAKFRTGEDEYDIVVRLPERERKSLDALEELTVIDEDGRPVPLRSLVRIVRSSGPSAIRRVDLDRVVTVEADVDYARGFQDAPMRDAAARVLADIELPPGIDWEFAGSRQEEQEAQQFLSRAFLVALMLIAFILVTEFDSLITPLTILVSVVLSLIGVLWGLIITATPFGIIMTGIGVISLAGIVVNNAIVLCDFIIQRLAAGATRREAILDAGQTRLRPVILTAVTTVLGLIPLTVGINLDFVEGTLRIGGESTQWWGPMGVAVIFGLSFATLLTLVVVPVTFDLLYGISRAGRRGETDPVP
ncbi:MAG: efflux RND transporter permease subunit [Acidobacteria bacterium]|nr:MAG: efflux RND transporter permease subunit [Acidobacteriota bacterium]